MISKNFFCITPNFRVSENEKDCATVTLSLTIFHFSSTLEQTNIAQQTFETNVNSSDIASIFLFGQNKIFLNMVTWLILYVTDN